jgi:hypothetical protein
MITLDNDRLVAIIGALAIPIAMVIVAFRQFRLNGVSAVQVNAIIAAAIADVEAKHAIIEDRNKTVMLLELERRERERAERERDIAIDSYRKLLRGQT